MLTLKTNLQYHVKPLKLILYSHSLNVLGFILQRKYFVCEDNILLQKQIVCKEDFLLFVVLLKRKCLAVKKMFGWKINVLLKRKWFACKINALLKSRKLLNKNTFVTWVGIAGVRLWTTKSPIPNAVMDTVYWNKITNC